MNRIKETLIEAGISQTAYTRTIQDSGNTECGCAYTFVPNEIKKQTYGKY